MYSTGSKTTANNLYRVAAAVIALFALGHTLGALVATPDFSAAADAVRTSMRNVAFSCSGSTCTWFGFYLGFGWMVSLFLIFTATLTWFTGGLAVEYRRILRPVTAALCVTFLLMSALSARFFFAEPLVLSLTVAAMLGWIVLKQP